MSKRQAPPGKRRLASALSLLLGLGTLVVVPAVTVLTTPQAAQAAVTAGDIVYTQSLFGPSGTSQIVLQKVANGPTVSLSEPNTDSAPDVSPDGSRIAMISTRRGYFELWVMNSDGSGAVDLRPTNNWPDVNFTDNQPRWSRDGQWITFWETTPQPGATLTEIKKIHPDGTGLTTLATGHAPGEGSVENPTWSPNGDKIAFDSDRDAPGSGVSQLYIMNADGTNQHRITTGTSGYTDSQPVWSPDGSRIYFISNHSYTTGPIWYYSSTNTFATATGPTQISGATNINSAARLSSDGTKFVFSGANAGGCSAIYTMLVGGGASSRFTADDCSTAQNTEPVFVSATFPTATAKTIVNLGDSVEAAEGIGYGFVWNGSKWVQTGPDFPAWTNTTSAIGFDIQGCHQTDYAHGRLLYAQNYKVFNMSCTGASTMAGILGQQQVTDEGGGTFQYAPPQLGGTCSGCGTVNARYDTLNPDIDTLSVTANDINFAKWVKTCYTPDALGCDSAANTNTVNTALATAKTNLRKVFTELNRRAALAHKTVFVVMTNYYNPFPLGTTTCADTTAWAGAIGITTQEKTWLTSKLGVLNSNIASEVTYAQQNDTSLKVRLADVSTTMNNHRYCDADPWVYGPSIDFPNAQDWTGNNNPSPFHPTPAGQRAMYNVVKAVIAAG